MVDLHQQKTKEEIKMKVLQFKSKRRMLEVNDNNQVSSITIEDYVETRVTGTTVLNLKVEATLIDGKVIYIKYGDWDIVWSLSSYSTLTIKGLVYSAPLVEFVEKNLTPIRQRLEEAYINSMKNESIERGVVAW
jgi:hypothetical protein